MAKLYRTDGKVKDITPKNGTDFQLEDLYESAFIMLLNRSNKVIGWAKISQGGISSTVVDIKMVCKYALDVLASGVILVHNHPSGNTHPGPEDISLTRKLRGSIEDV